MVNGRAITLQQILPLAKARLGQVSINKRDAQLPAVLRDSLRHYLDRELLLQEALARGISADKRVVEWNYDQARQGHPDEASWTAFLAKQGATPQSFREELRAQLTVAALIAEEVRSAPIPADEVRAAYDAHPLNFARPGAHQPPSFDSVRGEVEAALRDAKRDEIVAALIARLRGKARIELFL